MIKRWFDINVIWNTVYTEIEILQFTRLLEREKENGSTNEASQVKIDNTYSVVMLRTSKCLPQDIELSVSLLIVKCVVVCLSKCVHELAQTHQVGQAADVVLELGMAA
jgi:hypothetical protein